tara:strand:- start:2940 stop:3524 length:585 start_codon:yes stop_codon:yes gene_type:complete
MNLAETLKTVGTTVKEGYDAYNQFAQQNPLVVAAARQGINLARAQGQGPQMNMPSNYSFRHNAPTGSTRVGSQNVVYAKKGMKFPDLTGDGKVTFADILKGRGVGKGKEKKAMHGMKIMKDGGIYMGGGKMYDEMPDGGKMYQDGGEMEEYMGGGQMEYGHGGEMPDVVIKLAEQGMKMPKEQRAMLANMLMRD